MSARRPVPIPLLTQLAPDAAVAETSTVELRKGDRVSGEVLERSDDRIVLQHEILGRIEIPTADVEPPAPPNPGLFGSGLLASWKRTFSLGFSGQQGDSETNDLSVALDGDFEDAKQRWSFDARYNFSVSDGEKTKNNAMLGLGHDGLFDGSPWFAFARGRFDYDEFRTFELRAQAEGGVGYAFVERDDFTLRARTGPSVAKEWSADEFRAEWLLGPELVWQFTPSQRLEASSFFYYAFTPWGEFRNISALEWAWTLTESPVLSLRAGLANEYQSDVASSSEHNDLKYHTALGIDF